MRVSPLPHAAFIAFGSNLGQRRRTLENAIRALSDAPGVRLRAVSPLYETAPVGGPKRQGQYLNGVLRISCGLSPASLLALLRRLEWRFFRARRVKWGPRTLDLDLLSFDRRRLRTRRLTLPHPRYHERAFVLVPFCDIAPGFVHPGLKTTNRALLRRLTSDAGVTMMASWKESRFQPFKEKRKTVRPSSR